MLLIYLSLLSDSYLSVLSIWKLVLEPPLGKTTGSESNYLDSLPVVNLIVGSVGGSSEANYRQRRRVTLLEKK